MYLERKDNRQGTKFKKKVGETFSDLMKNKLIYNHNIPQLE